MNKNLIKKTEQWKSLERATLKQREIAEAYYAEELMGLITKEIKKAYLKWASESPMYIDITGGTKAMSAAAAMAGAVIDIQLVYMGSTRYLTDFRKPDPGSETLYYISNPYEVFGDLEIEKALQLFQQYNYVGAKEKLQKLLDKIPDPIVRQELELVCYLARVYEHWDALEFEDAYEHLVYAG